MAEPTKQVIQIWDDPESRINFLETVLKRGQWEAVVYHPQFDVALAPGQAHPLQSLATDLEKRGYTTSLAIGDYGMPALHVQNFGDDRTLSQSIRDMGLVKGVAHRLEDIGRPLSHAMKATQRILKQNAGDKAKLLGGFYLIGDVLLAAAGMGNKDGKKGISSFKDPVNLLESSVGIAGTVQSLIFMGFAKEGSAAVYEELMAKASKASEHGKDLFDVASWQDEKTGRERKGIIGAAKKVLEDHSLQTGAVLQVAGRIGMISSAAMRLQRLQDDAASGLDAAEISKQRSGAVKDILASLNSITGWALFLKKPKTLDEDKRPWNDPRRIWQEVQESPNKFASAFLASASLSGVAAGVSKGNKIQTMGNMTYLLGDGMMALTSQDSYGAAAAGNAEMLAEAGAKFMHASPLVMGEAEQAEFIGSLSRYLAERSVSESKEKPEKGANPINVDELATYIAKGLEARLPKVNAKTDEVAGIAAQVVSQFHPQFKSTVAGALAEAIVTMPGVAISKEALQGHIERQVPLGRTPSTKLVQMKDVSDPLAKLVLAIPGAADASQVNKLYDALAPMIRPQGTDISVMDAAIQQRAERDVAQLLAQLQQQQPNAVPVQDSAVAQLLAQRVQDNAQGVAPAR